MNSKCVRDFKKCSHIIKVVPKFENVFKNKKSFTNSDNSCELKNACEVKKCQELKNIIQSLGKCSQNTYVNDYNK